MSGIVETLTTSKRIPVWATIPVIFSYLAVIIRHHNLGLFIGVVAALVILHEMGHFWASKIISIQPQEFSIGFGRIIGQYTTKHNTDISFRILPLGGFVKFDTEKMRHATWKENMFILSGGPGANILTAGIMTFVLQITRGFGLLNSLSQTMSAVSRISLYSIERFGTLLTFPFQLLSNPVTNPTTIPDSPVQTEGGITSVTAQIATDVIDHGIWETAGISFVFFSITIGLFQLLPIYGLDGYQMLTQTIEKIANLLKKDGTYDIDNSKVVKAYGLVTLSYLTILSVMGMLFDIKSALS